MIGSIRLLGLTGAASRLRTVTACWATAGRLVRMPSDKASPSAGGEVQMIHEGPIQPQKRIGKYDRAASPGAKQPVGTAEGPLSRSPLDRPRVGLGRVS